MNSEDVGRGLSDPILKEHGPYTFRQLRKKELIGWNENETLLSFRNSKTYFFEPHRSKGHLNDTLTFINIPLVVSLFNLVFNYVEHLTSFESPSQL